MIDNADNYPTESQKKYSESVDGKCHMSAYKIIGELDNQLIFERKIKIDIKKLFWILYSEWCIEGQSDKDMATWKEKIIKLVGPEE